MSSIDFTSRLTNTSINRAATERIDHDLKIAGYGNMNANDILVQKNGHLELKMTTDQMHHGNKVVDILNKSLARETGGKSFGNIKIRAGAIGQKMTQPVGEQSISSNVQTDNSAITPVQPIVELAAESVSPTTSVNYSPLPTVRGASEVTATAAPIQDPFGQYPQKQLHGSELLNDIAHRIDSVPSTNTTISADLNPVISPSRSINDLVNGISPEDIGDLTNNE